jgi:hypothetical protein
MERHWLPAKLRWLSPQEGGRRQLPEGPEYAATARFALDEPEHLFSVVIRFGEPSKGSVTECRPVDISLLAPERLPDVQRRLLPASILIVTEGARPVAECRLA